MKATTITLRVETHLVEDGQDRQELKEQVILFGNKTLGLSSDKRPHVEQPYVNRYKDLMVWTSIYRLHREVH